MAGDGPNRLTQTSIADKRTDVTRTPADQNPLAVATQSLLAPAGLDEAHLGRALSALMRGGVDNADLYFQTTRHESWSLEDGIVREGSYQLEQGVGVRAMAGEKTGFAYSGDLVLPALMQASEAAAAIARRGDAGRVQVASPRSGHDLYTPVDPIAGHADADKVELLQTIDRETRRLDPRVREVMASLAAVHEIVLIYASDGVLAADVRPLVRLNVSVIVEDHDKREQGYCGGGGRFGYEYFIDSDRPMGYAREAVRQALVNLEAVPAPAGEMVVVLGPGWPGVLLHEAIGHGLEGDFNRKGTSAFAGRIGEKVASSQCTVVDDGTLAGRRGSLNIDDEGMPTENTVLIEEGRLAGYMQDRLNGRLMGVASTGNGRRESFAHLPLPRMTNTYMLPGAHAHDDIIASVDKGLYAKNFGGGQVDITSGKFVFSANEAYLIEDGKITRPVKGATLIGNGPDVLTRVSMVGNDLRLDWGVGVCGKDGQSVPVGVGQPTLKGDGPSVLQRVSMVGDDLEMDTGVGVCGKDGQSVPVGVGQPTLRIDGLTVGGTG
ncbi:MAG: metalloprotease TldD [Gammaproteobacteria bacterium]